MEKWHDITSGIDLPRIQRTFGALFGYILTLLLDPATVDQLAPPLLDLLGVPEEDHDFLALDFLPAIRNSCSIRVQFCWHNVLNHISASGMRAPTTTSACEIVWSSEETLLQQQ